MFLEIIAKGKEKEEKKERERKGEKASSISIVSKYYIYIYIFPRISLTRTRLYLAVFHSSRGSVGKQKFARYLCQLTGNSIQPFHATHRPTRFTVDRFLLVSLKGKVSNQIDARPPLATQFCRRFILSLLLVIRYFRDCPPPRPLTKQFHRSESYNQLLNR